MLFSVIVIKMPFLSSLLISLRCNFIKGVFYIIINISTGRKCPIGIFTDIFIDISAGVK
jgi:hypothetical protein